MYNSETSTTIKTLSITPQNFPVFLSSPSSCLGDIFQPLILIYRYLYNLAWCWAQNSWSGHIYWRTDEVFRTPERLLCLYIVTQGQSLHRSCHLMNDPHPSGQRWLDKQRKGPTPKGGLWGSLLWELWPDETTLPDWTNPVLSGDRWAGSAHAEVGTHMVSCHTHIQVIQQEFSECLLFSRHYAKHSALENI